MRRWIETAIPALLLLAAVALRVPALGVGDSPLLLELRNLVFDAYQRQLPRAYDEHAPVRIVDIDDESLRRLGQWDALRPRLVLGENIAQAAQFVASGAAELGLVALSLVMSPQLAGQGRWQRVPPAWHEPLEQTLVITRRAAADPDAQAFVEQLLAQGELLRRYGFEPIR